MADDDKIVIPVEVEIDKLVDDFETGKKSVDEFAESLNKFENFDLGGIFDKLDIEHQTELMKKFGLTAEETKNALIEAAEAAANLSKNSGSGSSPGGPPPPPPPPPSPPRGPREPRERDPNQQHYINVEQRVFGESGEAASESTAAIRLFREALHALHPALSEAGVGVGELSALVSAARGGFVALIAAVGGLLVTALEKAGDAANDAASRIGTFTGGLRTGREQYEKLDRTAAGLQTPTSDLVAPFVQATRVNQSQTANEQLPSAGLQDVIANIVKGAQSERQDTKEVLKDFTELLKGGNEKGVFTPGDLIKALDKIPNTLAAVIDRLPKGQSTFTGGQVLGAIQGAGPQINKNIEAQAELPESIARSWEKVKAAYERAEAAAPHGDVIAKAFDAIAAFFDKVGDARERSARSAENVRKLLENPPESRVGSGFAPGEQLGSAIDHPDLLGRKITVRPNQFSPIEPAAKQVPEPAFDVNGEIKSAAERDAEALKKHADTVEATEEKIKKFGLTGQVASAAASTDIGLQQAEIERRYEPRETEIKLEKDRISVNNADIHLEQAKISGLEAQKNVSLAGLAPEEARERVQGAESARDSALSKFFRNRGVDTSQLDAINAIGADQRELEAAETALKRARIEQRYAGLEEPKAKLAAEQTQTAIKSAEIEKRDTTLKLAKDTEGAPLSHELSQLKYADAVLKEEEKNNKFNEENVKLLGDILLAIGQREVTKSPEGRIGTIGPNGEINGRTSPSTAPAIVGPSSASPSLSAGTETALSSPPVLTPRSTTPSVQTVPPEQRTEPLEKRSEIPDGTQVAGLGEKFKEFLDTVSAAVGEATTKVQQQRQEGGPTGNLGIRGDITAEDVATGAGGGHVSGPGTSTSDSIDAKLSDGEFVTKASEVQRVGVDKMHALNSGMADIVEHFAGGGRAKRRRKKHSQFIVTDEDRRQADADAEEYDRYNASLDVVDYGYNVATGTQVRASRGGLITNFNTGGLASRISRATAPPIMLAAGGSTNAPAAAASEMQHWGTVDMRTDHGDYRAATERDTMQHISSNAQRSKRLRTGTQPNWYGGGRG